MQDRQKFYQSTWFTVLTLIFLMPLGVFLMWKYNKFNKRARIILSGIFVLMVLFVWWVDSIEPVNQNIPTGKPISVADINENEVYDYYYEIYFSGDNPSSNIDASFLKEYDEDSKEYKKQLIQSAKLEEKYQRECRKATADNFGITEEDVVNIVHKIRTERLDEKRQADKENQIEQSKTINLNTDINSLYGRFNEDSTFKLDTEPNSSAAVDEILSKAKSDCMPNGVYNEADKEYALNRIRELNYAYYTDRGTMELVMYLGRILEVSPDEGISTLGSDVIQSVKYVYRNAEKVEDESTQGNLEQVKKGFETISGESENPQETETSPTPEETETNGDSSAEVYVTPTGKKYHFDNHCNDGTYNPSTLEKAKAIGLTPCKKCAY